MRTLNTRAIALLCCLIFAFPACNGDSENEPFESGLNDGDDAANGRPSRPNPDNRDSGESESDASTDAGTLSDATESADASRPADTTSAADSGRDAGSVEQDVQAPPSDVSVADAGGVIDGQDCTSTDAHRYACCVLEQVNLFREQNGLPAYEWNGGVSETAFYYADYMAQNRVFAHSADGMSFGERLDEFNVAWASAGENLQRNDLSLWNAACNETVNGRGGWVNSRNGHREAMLGQDASGTDKRWTHAAAGVARNGNDWYVAMYFVRF